MPDDPLRIKRACATYKLKLSGLSAHTPLCKPDISVNYLKQAIRFAAECGAPVINTDEGPKPPWTTVEEDHALMRYTLQEAALVAEPRRILIGLEPHQQYSKHPEGLDRIFSLVKSQAIAARTRIPGSIEWPIVWCTCMPRTFAPSNQPPIAARSPALRSAALAAMV
jgi:sugar phosphate isomerase/epimerase